MKNQIIKKLNRLASRSYQERFCVHGNIHAYVLPEELYEDAVAVIRATLDSPVLSRNLSPEEINALLSFLRKATELDPDIPLDNPGVGNAALILSDPYWDELRTHAEKCLKSLGSEENLDLFND